MNLHQKYSFLWCCNLLYLTFFFVSCRWPDKLFCPFYFVYFRAFGKFSIFNLWFYCFATAHSLYTLFSQFYIHLFSFSSIFVLFYFTCNLYIRIPYLYCNHYHKMKTIFKCCFLFHLCICIHFVFVGCVNAFWEFFSFLFCFFEF